MANIRGPRVSMQSTLRLGRETVQFLIGKEQELFTVHKELICSSKYFRNMLQPRRKVVESDGECSICHDALDPGVKELTYCTSTCGSNFHRSCMDEWKLNSPSGPLRCPMCRSLWEQRQITVVYRLLSLDVEAFEIYCDWLYKTSVSVPPGDRSFEDAFCRLLKAFQLALHIGDPAFRKAILNAILPLCAEKFRPSVDMVVHTYAISHGPSPTRKLMILLHMELNDQEYSGVLADWDKYPARFQMDLTRALMRERAKGASTRDLKELGKKLWGDEWDLEDGEAAEEEDDDEEEEDQSEEEDVAQNEEEAATENDDLAEADDSSEFFGLSDLGNSAEEATVPILMRFSFSGI